MSRAFAPYPFEAKVHAPAAPGADEPSGTARHKVAIVGGGPVGLTLALALARQGVGSVLIEADSGVCTGSRAICVSRRSLQILDRLGVLAPFLAKGLPWTDGRSYFRGQEVLHFRMPHGPDDKLPPMLNLEQYYIEQFLLDAAETLPDLIDIRWATRVTGVAPGPDGVRLTLENTAGRWETRCDWLVACDGGQSLVRDALGLKLKGTSYENRYVIADILFDTDLPTERLAWFDPPSNPGSSVLMHRQPDGVWRIDYQLRPGEDADAAIRPENVIPRIAAHLDYIGQRGDWAPVWIASYRAHALSLERYRHGRVLFAGDAAHLVPIFGVRGANSGIDDADNLGWKLARVVRGASDALLDSYSVERVDAAQQNLGFGRKSAEFMAPPGFAYSWMRAAVLNLALDHPEVRPLINPRQSSAVSYLSSPLNAPDDGFTGGPRPGEVFAEGRLAGGFLSDRLGSGFTVLHFSNNSWPMPDISGASTVVIEHSALWSAWDARDGTTYLLRPDGHVLGRWRKADAAAIRAALAQAFGGRHDDQ